MCVCAYVSICVFVNVKIITFGIYIYIYSLFVWNNLACSALCVKGCYICPVHRVQGVPLSASCQRYNRIFLQFQTANIANFPPSRRCKFHVTAHGWAQGHAPGVCCGVC